MGLAGLLAQTSVDTSLLEKMPPNVLGAALILGVIFSFVLIIILITTIFGTIEKITLAKMSKSMIDDMLAKGYSPEEIRMVFEGEKTWTKLSKFFGMGKRSANGNPEPLRPLPPVKRTA